MDVTAPSRFCNDSEASHQASIRRLWRVWRLTEFGRGILGVGKALRPIVALHFCMQRHANVYQPGTHTANTNLEDPRAYLKMILFSPRNNPSKLQPRTTTPQCEKSAQTSAGNEDKTKIVLYVRYHGSVREQFSESGQAYHCKIPR